MNLLVKYVGFTGQALLPENEPSKVISSVNRVEPNINLRRYFIFHQLVVIEK